MKKKNDTSTGSVTARNSTSSVAAITSTGSVAKLRRALKILCTAVFIAFVFMAPAQAQNAKELAKEIMDSYAAHLEPVDALRRLNEADADKMVDAFMQYVAAPEAEVCRTALNMIHRVASRRGDAGLQKQVVRLFIRSLDDSESTIVSQAVGYLAQYPPEVFDSESRYLLTQRAKEKKQAQNKVVMLTGYLGITELTYNYRQMLNDEKVKDKRLRLSLQLAMTRLGDTTAIRELLVLAKKIPVGDDFVYDFCPNLAYTCQKEIYNLMFDIILSDNKNCFSSNPDSEKPIICAFRVIETIAPYIKDFPVTFDNTGEVDIADYPATLATVREWIKRFRGEVEFKAGVARW
jgi:hypothetical protein